MSWRCHTCGAPSANNEDHNWDDVTDEQWEVMYHAQELLAALRQCAARLSEWVDSGSRDTRDLVAIRDAEKAIAKAEGSIE